MIVTSSAGTGDPPSRLRSHSRMNVTSKATMYNKYSQALLDCNVSMENKPVLLLRASSRYMVCATTSKQMHRNGTYTANVSVASSSMGVIVSLLSPLPSTHTQTPTRSPRHFVSVAGRRDARYMQSALYPGTRYSTVLLCTLTKQYR